MIAWVLLGIANGQWVEDIEVLTLDAVLLFSICRFDKKLESFTHWPKHHPMKHELLAGAAVYHTGFLDKVTCFWCELTLHQWEVFDCTLEQHKKHSNGNCNFLKIYFPSKLFQ